jgi:ubiquitin-conjugating enzyme E2 D/E
MPIYHSPCISCYIYLSLAVVSGYYDQEIDAMEDRIMKELKEIEKNPPDFCSAGLVGLDVGRWQATIIGPPETPFAGGIFKLSLIFPPNYPMKPPEITFKTKIYHPNIDENGNICFNILKDDWSPAYTISAVLVAICSLLSSSNRPEGSSRP